MRNSEQIPETKPCLRCGIQITRKPVDHWVKRWAGVKYCSRACANAAQFDRKRTIPYPKKHCLGCGKQLIFPVGYRRNTAGNRKFCGPACMRGEHANGWRGGRFLVKSGYVHISSEGGSQRKEHRVIVEQALGRKLLRSEMVHHINGDKADNRKSNLLVCKQSYHKWLHEEMSRRYARAHFS